MARCRLVPPSSHPSGGVAKVRQKHRRPVLNTETLLRNFANEEQGQTTKKKRKATNSVKQQPAFKIIDVEAEKNSLKLAEDMDSSYPTSSLKQDLKSGSGEKSSSSLAVPDQLNPSYSFSAASHLDDILSRRTQPRGATVIKPPTVKLTNTELGVIPHHHQPSVHNPLVPTRSDMDQSLTRLANEKQTKMNQQEKRRMALRVVGDMAWEDNTLLEFDPNDFRIFVGDLGHEVTDEMLKNAFSAYPSVQKVRVIRRPGARKNRGYGFVSFKNPNDYLKAMKEMNGKYIGVRPIKIRKSTWKDRSLNTVLNTQKEKKKHGYKV